MKKLLSILGLSAAIAVGGTVCSVTPIVPTIEKAEAASYLGCYWAMNGGYYCYRYACTNFDRVALGCYDGYIRMNPRVYV